MTTLNSSVVYWNEQEITPKSILLISSGAGGDRLLFWHQITLESDQSISTSAVTTDNTLSHKYNGDPHANSHQMQSSGINPHSAVNRIGKSSMHVGPAETMTPLNTASTISTVPTMGLHHTASSVPASIIVGSPSQIGVCAGIMSGGPGETSTSDSLGRVGGPPVSCPSASVEMVVEDMAVSSLLSLLHPSTHDMQHKIYVKLRNKVFVGVSFSLNKTKIEISDPSVDPETTDEEVSGSPPLSNPAITASLIDFLDIFTVHAPSEVVGGKIAESCGLPHEEGDYSSSTAGIAAPQGAGRLSQMHKLNQAIFSFAIVFALSDAAPPCVFSHYTELARLIGIQLRRAELFWQYLSTERENIMAILDIHSSGLSSSGAGCAGRETGGGSGSHDAGLADGLSKSLEGDGEIPKTNRSRKPIASTVYALIAKRSSLCAELVHIVERVTSVGRVNATINGRYPIFFCLPFKAYAIMPRFEPYPLLPTPSSEACWPAIRPRAVWRSMEGMRPYHTLLLTSTRKSDLLNPIHNCDYFPADPNRSLAIFLQDLSPTTSLSAMSVRRHSQEHCLRLALWLVYHGHAIIIFPIVGNNVYTLSPLSHLWLQPHLLLKFAARFPHLNLAKVLQSFSEFRTFREQLNQSVASSEELTLHIGTDLTDSVNLISWLLRHRLIMQLHTYIIALTVTSDIETKEVDNEDSESREWDFDKEEVSSSEALFAAIHPDCVADGLLNRVLPSETERRHVLTHFQTVCVGTGMRSQMMCLFLRVLLKAPCHLEELMFVESVDRETLILCVEQFSPYLVTLRLPDPVTACFVGVEWPD